MIDLVFFSSFVSRLHHNARYDKSCVLWFGTTTMWLRVTYFDKYVALWSSKQWINMNIPKKLGIVLSNLHLDLGNQIF